MKYMRMKFAWFNNRDVANALVCKAWLRDADSRGALSNRFDQLFWDEEDSSRCSSDSD